jgi:hypothetical protein
MGRRYRPRPYDGRSVLVTAQDREASEPVEMAEFLTGPTQLVEVPGTHDSILEEPFVATLARSLEDAFASADPTSIRLSSGRREKTEGRRCRPSVVREDVD